MINENNFVLTKVDEILAWEKAVEHQKDTRFVELGRYLCEIRSGQYWRLEKLNSFDQFLEKRFPESWRKAHYLMSIHEYLPKGETESEDGGLVKSSRIGEGSADRMGSDLIVQPGCTRPVPYQRRIQA